MNDLQRCIQVQSFGCRVEPADAPYTSVRDSRLATVRADTGTVIDNSIYFRPISNQLQLPACVANAGADLMEAACVVDAVNSAKLLASAQGRPFDFSTALTAAIEAVPDLSRMFLWWCCRNEMLPSEADNPMSGTYISYAMDVLSRFGICDESMWPYSQNAEYTRRRPALIAFAEAMHRRFSAYYKIDETGDRLIETLILVLGAQHNVAFSTEVDASYSSYKEGVVYPPASLTGARHAQVICGWDPKLQAFKVRNSWTDGWGQQGYCWMHISYVTWLGTGAFWVPTKGLHL